MKYTIVIPCHGEDMTIKTCVESIASSTNFNDFDGEILFVANNIKFQPLDYIINWCRSNKQVNTTIIHLNEGIGYTSAVNLGAKLSKGDYLIVIDSDCRILDFGKNSVWIDMLYKPFEIEPSVAMSVPQRLLISTVGTPFWFAVSCLMMIRRDVWLKVGGLDEDFFASGCDIEFSLRLDRMGCPIWLSGYNKSIHTDDDCNDQVFPMAHEGTSSANMSNQERYAMRKLIIQKCFPEVYFRDYLNFNRIET